MLRRLLYAAASRLDDESLEDLQRFVQRQRGLGWGTATVTAEVAAARTLAEPGAVQTVLDVGANRGEWTRAALAAFPDAHVHAFEPGRTTFDLLSSTVGREERVTLYNTAVGPEPGTAMLYADAAGSGMASLTRRRLAHFDIAMDVAEEVEVTTLDQWFAASGAERIDVLKLDVEGHELDVLRAGATALARTRVVQFEFGGCNIDTRTYFQDFWYLLAEGGFRLHRLSPSGLVSVQAYSELGEVFVTTNYFASRA